MNEIIFNVLMNLIKDPVNSKAHFRDIMKLKKSNDIHYLRFLFFKHNFIGIKKKCDILNPYPNNSTQEYVGR